MDDKRSKEIEGIKQEIDQLDKELRAKNVPYSLHSPEVGLIFDDELKMKALRLKELSWQWEKLSGNLTNLTYS